MNLSTLPNLAALVLEEDPEKLSRCMLAFIKNKRNFQIVTNERSRPLYTPFHSIQTTYDPTKYEVTECRGYTLVFDDCFTDPNWIKDTKLHDLISYPRMLGVTTVVGVRDIPSLSPRMCWNLDMICVGTTANHEKIYDSFFLYLISYEEFCERLETATKGDGFLVLYREGTKDTIYQAYC